MSRSAVLESIEVEPDGWDEEDEELSEDEELDLDEFDGEFAEDED
ncbi:MAG TPA: hypothetical protein VIC05_09650 [Solirubrobacteraceae bacterium]|jgi:hypothetical protein